MVGNIYLKRLLRFSIPIFCSQVLGVLGQFLSMIIIGRINGRALAASAIIFSVYGLMMMLAISFIIPVGIVTRRFYAKKDINGVYNTVFHGILIACGLGILLSVTMYKIGWVLNRIYPHYAWIEMVEDYYKPMAMGIVAQLMNAVWIQYFLATDRLRLTFFMSLVNAVLMPLFTYIFVYGVCGSTALGIAGGGLAITLLAWVNLIGTGFYLWFRDPINIYAGITWNFKFHPKSLVNLIVLGWPIACQYSLELLAFSTLTYMMGFLGEGALAAQQILMQVNSVAVLLPISLASAVALIIAEGDGGGKSYTTFHETVNHAVAMTILILFTLGLFYAYYPLLLSYIYLHDSKAGDVKILHWIKAFFIITAVSQIFDGVKTILAGVYRGLQDMKTPLWISFIAYWLIGLPLAYGLGIYHKADPIAVRMGFAVGILSGFVILGLHFRRYYFKHTDRFYARMHPLPLRD